MVGFKVTREGWALLDALISGGGVLWVPGVNYERLWELALTLNSIAFETEDGCFSIEPEEMHRKTLLHMKALERDGYIERSHLPSIEKYLRGERFLQAHPGKRFLFLEDDL